MSQVRVTATMVAEAAGVSQSAVSRVFTEGASVSADTREKVMAAADRLGYRPNTLARSLITGKSRVIGLVLGYMDNQFYPEAVEKLSRALQAKGYHLMIFIASNTREEIDEVLHDILAHQVDGIVLASVALTSDLASRCDAAGVPVVLFNRTVDDPRMWSVSTDNYTGGRAMARELIDAGCERIAYIAGWEGASTQIERERGFLDELAAAGRHCVARSNGEFHLEQTQFATRELFAGAQQPDGVFVANDHMAFAAMDVIRFELKLSIPGDVCVVGFDDVPLASWPSYDLTTYRQPINQMVARTVSALFEHMEDPDATPQHYQLPGHVVRRQSVSKRG